MTVEMGNRLTELRRRAELSQEMLAEQLQVSRQAVSKWERGEACPDMENLIMLSRLYGVSLDMLLRGQEWEDGDTPQQDDPGEESTQSPEPPTAPQEEPAREDRKKASQVPPQDGVYKRKMGLAWLQEYPLTNLGVSILFLILIFGFVVFRGYADYGYWHFESSYDPFIFISEAGNVFGLVYVFPWLYRTMRIVKGKSGAYVVQGSRAGRFFQTFPYAFCIMLLHIFALTVGEPWVWLFYLTIPFYEWLVKVASRSPSSGYQIALSFPISNCVLCFSCFFSRVTFHFWPYLALLAIPVYYAIVVFVWSRMRKMPVAAPRKSR